VSKHDGQRSLRVCVIRNDAAAAEMLRDLVPELQRDQRLEIDLTDDSVTVAQADLVLLLLTRDVLQPRSQSLALLEENIRCRMISVHSEDAGWAFGSTEQEAAPPDVQEWLDQNEALAYRPKGGGPNRHEFVAMARHLANRLVSKAFG
jgi:hypothetical protein